mgnify:CR=1 FL=1
MLEMANQLSEDEEYSHALKFYKSILIDLYKEALRAADPLCIIPKYIPKSPPQGKTIVIGAGKASARMAKSFEDNWLERNYGVLEGLVITRYGHGEKCKYIDVVEASHPIPDEKGLNATSKIINLVSNLSNIDLVIFLVSGCFNSFLVLFVNSSSLSVVSVSSYLKSFFLCDGNIC